MRLIPTLLLSVALAASVAGCFGSDDPPAETTPTPPTATAPTGATPTTAPTTPTPGGNDTTPQRPAPREVHSSSATFQHAPAVPPDPTNPSPPVTTPFPVPAGYTTLTMNVTWGGGSAPQGGIVGTELRVQMLDPTGAPIGTACTIAAGPHADVPAVCTQTATIPATGGEYAVQTSGSGTYTAAISIVAS